MEARHLGLFSRLLLRSPISPLQRYHRSVLQTGAIPNQTSSGMNLITSVTSLFSSSPKMKLALDPPSADTVPAPPFDWSQTDPRLARAYEGFYVKVIDDVFTPEECAAMIALAESDDKWIQAAVHYGLEPHQKYVDTSYRNSERILRWDHDAAEKIYQRLLPHVHELVELKAGDPWATVIATPSRMKGLWKLVGVNERLSFLRYGPGNYFRGHCDGQLELEDGRKARVTLQIYLGDDDVKGGATRISTGNGAAYYDVEPKKGRVLIFQQRSLWHSGEDVTEGTKYTLRSDFLFRQEDLNEA